MGPIWGRQDPGGPHVGPMNFVIWVGIRYQYYKPNTIQRISESNLVSMNAVSYRIITLVVLIPCTVDIHQQSFCKSSAVRWHRIIRNTISTLKERSISYLINEHTVNFKMAAGVSYDIEVRYSCHNGPFMNRTTE